MSSEHNPYFQFFDDHIPKKFRTDTNNRIGPYWFHLVYPVVWIQSREPYDHEATLTVQQDGVDIKPDCYPFFKFIEEHPQVCESLVNSCPYLVVLYETWRRFGNIKYP